MTAEDANSIVQPFDESFDGTAPARVIWQDHAGSYVLRLGSEVAGKGSDFWGLQRAPSQRGVYYYVLQQTETEGDPSVQQMLRAVSQTWNWTIGKRGVSTFDLESLSDTSPLASVFAVQDTERVEKCIRSLFARAESEHFEDGLETDFSRQLVELVKTYGDNAVEVLAYLILREKVSVEAASEAMRWLGQIEDASTLKYRRWVLEQSLSSPSPMAGRNNSHNPDCPRERIG